MAGKRKSARARRVNKVLVANRGEIAVRIIRACHELDIPAVAVYSEADRRSLHVLHADDAVCIGAPPPLASYLNADAIIAAAKATGADAIHPGYGFLAENASFAERVEKEGLTFIGPPSSALRAIGGKLESRARMKEAGVPLVPGMDAGTNDPAEIVQASREFELPIFIKASAGGGGKGLRLVTDRSQVEAAARAATGEARSSFNDDTVYIEKKIEQPRHIEFQVLADMHGNVVHLFERECSIQRRHQKLVEETPSTALAPELRVRMGEAAVAAARAVGYVNALTVEFILDQEGNFYFLEMNTRIQVEHPITELTTGIDLVQWQLRIARGEPLAFRQEDLFQRGHAIECRIYAEDEMHHFMPSCGVISLLRQPSGPGIRNDLGVYEGWEVTPYYDPLLSKLCTYGENREMARYRMLRALDEYIVHGVATGIDLHRRILTHPAFVSGHVNTEFLEEHAGDIVAPREIEVPDDVFIAAALADELGMGVAARRAPGADTAREISPWEQAGNWEIGGRR